MITLSNLVKVAAIIEIATGIALIACPSCVALLLLGSELVGPGPAVGRVAGCGLFSLGIACWSVSNTTVRAMLAYGSLITVYLVYLGIDGQWVGWVLWPAAALHAILTLLIAWRWKI